MPPILLNRPLEMLKVSIVTPSSFVDRLFEILHEEGVVHITKVGKETEEYISRLHKIEELKEKISYIVSFKRGAIVNVELTVYELQQLTLDKIEDDINALYNRVHSLEELLKSYEKEYSMLAELKRILGLLSPSYEIRYLIYRGKYLGVLTIVGKPEQVSNFIRENKLSIINMGVSSELTVATIIIPIDHYNDIMRKAQISGINIVKIREELSSKYNTIGELLKYIEERLAELEDRIRDTKSELEKLVSTAIDDLGKYKVILENMYDRIKALLQIASYKYLTLVSGWIPKKYTVKLEKRLEKEKLPAYVEYAEPSARDEPPTLLENPPIINYFEPIVKFIGVPRYHEWDPTPIVAYSFALFYGIMLGDMGYAIAIILAAYFILDKLVVDIHSRDYQLFKRSIIVSSIVGFIIGSLNGTLFGDTLNIFGVGYAITNVFSDPLAFLGIALLIGLIHVNIAHAIALAKHIKHKNIGDVISEIGLFIAEIFGIPYIMYTMLNTSLPFIPTSLYSYMLYGAFVGIALIIIGMIKSLGFLGILMWLFNITGLLGDVLSYSRLAGVGIATIYLAASFNLLAKMAYNGLYGALPPAIAPVIAIIPAILIAFFGHLINTALSALGSFIHSLRLCFVEFLTKFYEGDGYLFEPLKLVLKRRIALE